MDLYFSTYCFTKGDGWIFISRCFFNSIFVKANVIFYAHFFKNSPLILIFNHSRHESYKFNSYIFYCKQTDLMNLSFHIQPNCSSAYVNVINSLMNIS